MDSKEGPAEEGGEEGLKVMISGIALDERATLVLIPFDTERVSEDERRDGGTLGRGTVGGGEGCAFPSSMDALERGNCMLVP